ncbi:MAG: signal peptidase II [Burkholderiales bacterium]
MSAAPAGLRRLAPWLLVAAVVAVLDQTTKAVVQAMLQPGARIPVLPFLDLVLVFNDGAAFSFLAGAGGWQRAFFIGIALAAAVLIVHLLRRHPGERLFCAGLALILGGAAGNLWDRVVLGHVVDFVLLHAHGWHWPAFNVADSAITVGAAALIWDGVFGHRAAGPDGRRA